MANQIKHGWIDAGSFENASSTEPTWLEVWARGAQWIASDGAGVAFTSGNSVEDLLSNLESVLAVAGVGDYDAIRDKYLERIETLFAEASAVAENGTPVAVDEINSAEARNLAMKWGWID